MSEVIDRNGFEAAAWRRRAWLSLYNAQRYLNLERPHDDSVMDSAIAVQRAAARAGGDLARGLRPSLTADERWFVNWWTELPVDIMRERPRPGRAALNKTGALR